MRHLLALAMLAACMRLWLTLNTGLMALSVSEAHQDISRPGKEVEEPWLQTVEGIMNGPPRWRHDPDRQVFDRIIADAHRLDYEAAASGLRAFLELHPTSSLVAQAHYWLGECEYQLGHYEAAIQSFEQAVARTTFDPQLATAAFLRKSSSYARLGHLPRSRQLLELLVVQFPSNGASGAPHSLPTP